jgi:hypothetical protein
MGGIMTKEIINWFDGRLVGKTIEKTEFNYMTDELKLTFTDGKQVVIFIGRGWEDAPILDISEC